MIIKIYTSIQVHTHMALVARYEQLEFPFTVFVFRNRFQHTFTMGKRHENKYY